MGIIEGTGEGQSWFGGFPEGLVSDLESGGFSPDDFSEYSDSDYQTLIDFHAESGPDFTKNIAELNKAFKLLPAELQKKYKDRLPQLLNSAPLIRDMAALLKRFQSDKEIRESSREIQFKGMEAMQQEAELRDIRDQLSRLLYSHEANLKGKMAREGRAQSW